ncbi:hypothetical protein PRK78_000409 [Emydomyces testavorans]|uniref:Uncharacterized protein n=1 Tax=Emydomyces testavorans TaxID=2070801 RepID=A0AAF0DCF6_9EURO|nr:hypothetical protein PRK78_000409 [Emydomyces testavorans]
MISETGFLKKSDKRMKGQVIPEFKAEASQRPVQRWDSEKEKLYADSMSDEDKWDILRDTIREADEESEPEEVRISFPDSTSGKKSEVDRISIHNKHSEDLEVRKAVPKSNNRRYLARVCGNNDKFFQFLKARSKTSLLAVSMETLVDLVDDSTALLLRTLNERDFGTIGSFLLTGEYPPILIECRGGRHPLGNQQPPPGTITYYLEGLVTKREYEQELIRCGEVYNLAHKLKLPRLKMVIIRKLKFGFLDLEQRHIVKIADSIFSSIGKDWNEPYVPRYATEELFNGRYEREMEPMRAFLVDYFASKLASVSISMNEEFKSLLRRYPDLRAGILVRAAERAVDQCESWSTAIEVRTKNVQDSNDRSTAR